MFQRVLTIIFLLIIALKIPLILVLCVIVAAAILWVAVGFHVGLQDGEFMIVPLQLQLLSAHFTSCMCPGGASRILIEEVDMLAAMTHASKVYRTHS